MSQSLAITAQDLSSNRAGSRDARRANLIYRSYLDAAFKTEAYRCVQKDIIGKARWSDLVIGISAALSGGSGLGILADARLAWPCGVLTSLSVILSVVKGVWDWPGQLKFVADLIKNYTLVSAKYKLIVDEINVQAGVSPDLELAYKQLRDEENKISPASFDLDEAERRKIQTELKSRIDYQNWWGWIS